MACMLDEKALRKPDFSEGPKVALGDGQEWTFPRPWLRLYPVRDGDGSIGLGGGMSYGADYEDKLDTLVDLGDDPDKEYERMSIMVGLAAGLLLCNYDLTDRALRRLLPLDTSAEANGAMWGAIGAVLGGSSAPKPTADGSAILS
jgi:hypothetical protein